MTKLIAVVGATGAQGGGLVRAILDDPSGSFKVRAITRKPNSEQAQQLSKLGAEVVSADLDDTPSVRKAFAEADCAFCMTTYWEHLSPEREMAHAHSLAHAAKQAEVPHVIWSTLEDTRERVPLSNTRMPTLQRQYKVPHFDAKGASDHFFSRGEVPTTFLRTSFHWENLIDFALGPRRRPDGKLSFVLPMANKKLPGIAAEDIGRCALGIFKRRNEFIGKTVGIAGEHLTGTRMAEQLSRALGQPIAYDYVPPETFRKFAIQAADTLGNMFQYERDFETEYCAARDLNLSRALNPQLQTFAAWLERNKQRIPLPA